MQRLGWRSFRHKMGALMRLTGASKDDRKALMGHATDEMAEHYGEYDPILLGKTREAQNKVVRMLKKTGTEN